MKKPTKSKVMWFSVALAVLSVLQGFILKMNLGPDAQMYLGLIVAITIAVLRVFTETSVSFEDTEAPRRTLLPRKRP